VVGCGECGAFGKLGEIVEDVGRVVNGVRYVGKIGALRCKKCGSVWHDPEEEADFRRAVDRVAQGLDPEGANDFHVRRAR
jgi:hypothetical protein